MTESANPELYALIGTIATALISAVVRMFELSKIKRKTKKAVDEAYESGKALEREQFVRNAYKSNSKKAN